MRERNTEVGFLVQYLRDCCVTGIDATYAEASILAEGDTQRECRWKLLKALEIVRDEYGFVMANIANVGYRKVDSELVPIYSSGKRINKIRSQTRRCRKELNAGCRDRAPTLSDFYAYSAIGLVEVAVSEKAQEAIKAVATENVIDWVAEREKTNALLMGLQS